MFEKKKLKARKTKPNKAIGIIGMVSVSGVFLLAILVLNQLGNGNFDVYKNFNVKGPTTFFDSQEEREKDALLEKKRLIIEEKRKQDEAKTNVLIIGRGGYGNDAPELTDSIILASLNKDKNHISMLSIPRDLYVNYGDTNKYGEKNQGKINGLYVHYLAKFQDEEKAIEKLKEKISQITNEKIDHYINIDFRGFSKLIDSLGGVQIEVPKTLIDYEYPDNNHGYQTFILRKGNWLLDGNVALKYVRSRKNTGGDFGRSERQQQVIEALKSKMLSGGYLTSPSKIKNLYNIFAKHLTTDIGILKSVQIFSQVKLQENTKVYSSGLNASCIKKDECQRGGFLYYPQRSFFGGQSVLLGESATHNNLDTFNQIQKYSSIVFNNPKLFEEKYKISIFSRQQDKEEATLLREELKKFGLEINVLERIGLISKPQVQNVEKKQNLIEYNEAKLNAKTEKNSASTISQEYNNPYTKIIFNNMAGESHSIEFLKKYLGLDEEDIIENNFGPKYARDKNTQIEILYKN